MTEEYLAAIGRITTEFAQLEHQVEFAIWSLLVGPRLEDQRLGQIVTADLSFSRAVDLFFALVRYRFPDAEDAGLKSLSRRVIAAEHKRNQIVHSGWALAENQTVMRIKSTARGRVKTQFQQLAVSDLLATAQEIHDAAEAVLNFHLGMSGTALPRVTL